MNRDFTLDIYKKFLSCIKRNGYAGVSYLDYIQAPRDKQFIIRHDVDKLPKNSITTAIIESEFDLKGTYYFRIVPDSFDVEALKIIASHGHEIGYHYEDLSLCNGDKEKAIKHFEISLNELRKYVDIKTICMHGSPLSKYDNKSLWTEYNYKDYDIIAEPYIDIDFNKIFYLSDTGRSWNSSINIRDHVNTRFNLKINSTNEMISLIDKGNFPDTVMFNTHPQRWTDNWILWTKELVSQNIKNIFKRLL